MPPTLELIGRRPIAIESALEEERNVINWASYGPATDKLYRELWGQRDSIGALVQHHLGGQNTCTVLPPDHWIRGSFNVCVFVEVNAGISSSRKVIFRCPMPHKLAEARYPGSIDEKLGCEVGAYIWVQEHCPEIRSPDLFGFGFLDGRHVRLACRLLAPRSSNSLPTRDTCPSSLASPGSFGAPSTNCSDFRCFPTTSGIRRPIKCRPVKCVRRTWCWSTSVLKLVRCCRIRLTRTEKTKHGGRGCSRACRGFCFLSRVFPRHELGPSSSTTMAPSR